MRFPPLLPFPSFVLLPLILSSLPTILCHPTSSSSSHSNHLSPRSYSCPPSSLLGQFWPEWEYATQLPKNFPFTSTDLAFYFALNTAKTGFTVPTGDDLNRMVEFVRVGHSVGKKVLFTVGGWDGSVYFSHLVSTSSSRTAFAKVIKTFMTTYKFDGVDIDWEYPGQQGAGKNYVSSSDAANLLLFLEVLRSTIGTSKLITADVSPGGFVGPTGATLTSTKSYATYIDYLTVMGYDFYDYSYSPSTGPNAPLAQCNSQSGSDISAINQWIASGFPACKILLGVPSYSHIFRTESATLKQTTFNGVKTLAFQELASQKTQPADDTWTYTQLIQNKWLNSAGTAGAGGYTRYWDTCTSTPFLFDASTKLFISYDDPVSIGLKAAYARSKGLAGINIYDSTGPTTAMLSAAREGLEGKFKQSNGVLTKRSRPMRRSMSEEQILELAPEGLFEAMNVTESDFWDLKETWEVTDDGFVKS